MKRALIIGKANAGKTLFMLNFAEFLGLKKIIIKFQYPSGRSLKKEMTIDAAKAYLSSKKPYKTRCIQSTKMNIKVYKGHKELNILDSSGLMDGIHPELAIRNGIIQTLDQLENCDLILHIIDTHRVKNKGYISKIDKQIINYGNNKKNYALLPNKIDLDEELGDIKFLRRKLKSSNIFPISALYKTGFNEVKTFVLKSL